MMNQEYKTLQRRDVFVGASVGCKFCQLVFRPDERYYNPRFQANMGLMAL
jgi:hypothetical protein